MLVIRLLTVDLEFITRDILNGPDLIKWRKAKLREDFLPLWRNSGESKQSYCKPPRWEAQQARVCGGSLVAKNSPYLGADNKWGAQLYDHKQTKSGNYQ